MATKELNPAQHTNSEEPIKAILGGAMTLVNGIGTLQKSTSQLARSRQKPVKLVATPREP